MTTVVDEFRLDSFDEFVGQQPLKDRLAVHIDAAVAQNRVLDHVLFCGRPGFGKTSLARIIANRLGAKFETFEMPLPDRKLSELVRTFHGVLLLDEIHRAPARLQEKLFPLLEFGWLQNGGSKVYADRLTIIGATTEREKVIKPLYDRFAIVPDFDPYSDPEMGEIVTGMAAKACVTMTAATAVALGRATGGTPRKARQFVLAARDLAATGTEPTSEAILNLCRVDPDGVTYDHKKYLKALYNLGGVAGLVPLRNILELSEGVVRELEKLLVDKDMITYTERGRELTGIGQEKLRGE